jgi:hypothetical protein
MTARFALAGACLTSTLLGAGCQEHHFATCDITKRACQEDVYYRMLTLRGDGYDPLGGLPPVNVISESEFRDMLIQEQSAQSADGPSPWDKALALLHFTSDGTGGAGADGGTGDGGSGSSTTDDQVTHTYAFYDPKKKTITIISHPNQSGANAQEEAMVTLAHELVHALQDRQLDLNKDDFKTSDEYLAYDTIIEGDARFYEYLFVNQVLPLIHKRPADALAMPKDELDYVYHNATDEGTPMFVAQLLTYSLGATYEAREYRSGGNAAIRHGYSKEPHHTVGFLCADDGKAQPSINGDSCPGLVASSLTSRGADELGALMFYAFLRGWKVDHDTALAAAQDWTGDVILVQTNKSGSVTAASWRIELATPPPSAIANTLGGTGELTVTQQKNALQITATDSPTALTWKPSDVCP